MQVRYFELEGSGSVTNFWEISIFSFSYILRTGQVGICSDSQVREFQSADACAAAVEEAIRRIGRQGYREVTQSETSEETPAADAVVLGGDREAMPTAVVLGGLEGIQQCLKQAPIADQVRTILTLPEYGQPGLELLLSLLHHDSLRIVAAAYDRLRRYIGPELQYQLLPHTPYEVFECLHKLDVHFFDPEHDFWLMSRDSQTVTMVAQPGEVKQFRLATGETIASFTINGGKNSASQIRGAALSRDEQSIYVGWISGKVEEISLTTGKGVRSFNLKACTIFSVTVSGDGRLLVVGFSTNYKDYWVSVWDTETGQCLQTHQSQGSEPRRLVVSTDNQRIVYQCGYQLAVWAWQQNQSYVIPRWDTSPYLPFGLTPQRQTLLVFNSRTWKEFDLATGECLYTVTLPTRDTIERFSLAPDGTTAILADKGFGVWWNYQTGKIRRKVPEGKTGIFSPDGQYFLTRTSGGPEIWGVRPNPIKLPPLTPDDSLDELRYLCSLRSHKDQKLRNWGATEEALVRDFLGMADRHGYALTIDDIRPRARRKSGFSVYYYILGDRVPDSDRNYARPPLNFDRPDIDEAMKVLPDSPELYPF